MASYCHYGGFSVCLAIKICYFFDIFESRYRLINNSIFRFQVFGWALVGVGAWSLYEFAAYEAISLSVPYAVASKLIIVAGVFNVLASFFGFWVTAKDNRRLLVIVSLLHVSVFIT